MVEVAPGSPTRWMFVTAIVGVVSFWTIVLVLGVSISDYDSLQYAVSVLTTRGMPYAKVAQAAFAVLGLSVILFAVGLARAEPTSGRAHTPAVALLVVHGIGRIGEGLFPFGGSPLNARLHALFAIPGVLAMIVIPFVIYRAGSVTTLKGSEPWGRNSVLFGALFAGLFIVIGPFSPVSVPLGLAQRTGFLLWYLWFVILAVEMAGRARTRAASQQVIATDAEVSGG